MRITRRAFLGASAGLAAGLGASPALAWLEAPMQPAWTTSAPPVPGLGYLTTLAVDPFDTATLLAGGDVFGMRHTTDGGQLWGQIDRGLWQAGRYGISAIAPHPAKAGTFYLLSGSDTSKGAVYRTTNGARWELRATGIATEPQTDSVNGQPVLRVYGRLLALDASGSSDVLYAASYRDGLFRSRDAGATWSPLGSFASRNLTAVVLDPTNPSVIYVGWRKLTQDWSDQNGGIEISTDGGASWAHFLSNVPVRDLVLDPQQAGHVYVAALTGGVWRTLDGGSSWSAPNTHLPLQTPAGTPTYFNAIAVNPNPGRAGEVLVGTGEGNTSQTFGSIYRSQDSAASWTDLVRPDHVFPDDTVIAPAYYYPGGHGYAASAVIVPPSQPNTIWVSGRTLLWKSTDDGQSWFPSSAGLEGAGRHFDVGIDPTTGAISMGTGDWTLLQSDAARQVFTLLGLPNAGPDVRSLCFAFSPGLLLIGTGTKGLDLGNVGGLYVWKGSSQGWQPTGSGLPGARVVGLASAPSNPGVVYAAVCKKGVYKSTDGGATFAPMPSPVPDPTTMFPPAFTKAPVAVHPTRPNVVYVLDHASGLFAFSPSTGAWTNVSAGVPVAGNAVDAGKPYQGFALDPTQPSRLYLATPAGLFRSVDAGSSWGPPAAIPNTEGFGPLAVDPTSGWAFACTVLPDESSALTDRPGIYVSIDGGTTWSGAYVDGRFAVNFDVLTVDPTTPMTVWAASGGSLFSLTPAS